MYRITSAVKFSYFEQSPNKVLEHISAFHDHFFHRSLRAISCLPSLLFCEHLTPDLEGSEVVLLQRVPEVVRMKWNDSAMNKMLGTVLGGF
jgi:hypothetical protein